MFIWRQTFYVELDSYSNFHSFIFRLSIFETKIIPQYHNTTIPQYHIITYCTKNKYSNNESKMFALCFTQSREEPKPTGSLAGTMTMGGSDVRLHKTKMVYAENIDEEGWYTVYVKGIYLQMKEGHRIGHIDDDDNVDDDAESEAGATVDGDADAADGDADAADDASDNAKNVTYVASFVDGDTIKLDLDIEKLNKEGIIIDSGTTDTYLPSSIKEKFEDAFEELYGYTMYDTIYNFNPEEIVFEDLPTIIIQLRRAKNVFDYDDDAYEGSEDEYEPKLLAGSLDETSPDDVIIEIPPNHYLSYNKKRKKLQTRIHIDDDDGFGLLGANFMFNYDILFDMDNSRVGFARSDCDHAQIED